jgi:hypothetical protein
MPASFTRYVLHSLSSPPPTGSTKPLSWSTEHDLLHQLTRPAWRICFINATGEVVLLQQRHGRIGSTPPATTSTASDLLHQRPCPPHQMYSIDDRVHRTRSTSPTTTSTA